MCVRLIPPTRVTLDMVEDYYAEDALHRVEMQPDAVNGTDMEEALMIAGHKMGTIWALAGHRASDAAWVDDYCACPQ